MAASVAVWVPNDRNGGGTYDTTYPWRIVIHEIQGNDSLGMIASHPYPPHRWYDPISRDLHETVPLDRSAFALYQYPHNPTKTNKGRALQVEVAGFTSATADETDQMLRNIAEDVVVPLVQFARSQGGDIDLTDIRPIVSLSFAAREDWQGRMSDAEWREFNGICGHMHVPQNDHWDPGAMDLHKIAQYAIELLDTIDQPEDTMTPAQEAKLDEALAVSHSVNHLLSRMNMGADLDLWYLPDGTFRTTTANGPSPAPGASFWARVPAHTGWTIEAATAGRPGSPAYLAATAAATQHRALMEKIDRLEAAVNQLIPTNP